MELKLVILVVGFSATKNKIISIYLEYSMYLELHLTIAYCQILICQIFKKAIVYSGKYDDHKHFQL